MTEKLDFHNRAVKKVKQLWNLYILGEDPQQLEKEFDDLPDNLLMIGTGLQEFYQTRDKFLAGIAKSEEEASDIQFEMHDEWYEVQDISDNVCVVYGGIWAREKVLQGQTIFVDMQDSRFSIVCKDTDKGVEMCSIHHSMPYVDQGVDEYYPKTLSCIARELEQRAEMDRMTEIYSRYYMEQHVTKAMKQSDGYFLAIDLDDFKNINDTMGHLIGDQVIKAFAAVLRKIASPTALLGRMGGDEFAVWDCEIKSNDEAESKFATILSECKSISDKLGAPVSCSGGIVFCAKSSEEFASVYNRADKALYYAKAHGKKRLFSTDKF